MKQRERLVLRFHNNTLKHLGISLYSTLPPVIAELVANSYDANANNVNILINDDKEKSITINDDGDGMNYDDIRAKFLVIGRNRREEDLPNLERLPIGKKGIGKLSVFGIAKEVTVDSSKSNIRNCIKLNLDEILKEERGIYYPELIYEDKKQKNKNGTTIYLNNLLRKTSFNIEYINALATSLTNRFMIFNQDFKVQIIYNHKHKISVTNILKFASLKKIEFKWIIPADVDVDSDYHYKNEIVGEILTTETPAPADMKGIILTSRGKLVNKPEFFGSKSDDYAYTYMTGWLEVGFIEDFENDIIATNRESLNWEDENAVKLQKYLSQLLLTIKNQWREKRRLKKKTKIEEESGSNIDEWISNLNIGERQVAKKIINAIIDNENIDTEKAASLIEYVKGSFEFESFKYYANVMSNLDTIDDSDLVKLIKDWELVEAREFYNLAQIRVKAINNFENYIETNAKEVPTLHKFLKKFSWLLDPRILKFEDEVTYSKLLKSKFADNHLPKNNRRIDFLCVDFVDSYFIIELKRPNAIISDKELDQALDYVSFLENKLSNERNKNVTCFIICDKIVDKLKVRKKAEQFKLGNSPIIVKSYRELLINAKKYNDEFIKKYNSLKR